MKLIKHSRILSNIKRFASINLTKEYSVGEHSFRVAILAMQIVDHYNLENETKISVEETLRKALLHDLEEAVAGDIPNPVKERTDEFKMAYKKLARIIMEEDVLEDNALKEMYLKLWAEDKAGETGEIILLADLLESLQTAYYEVKKGNFAMVNAHKNICGAFKKEKIVKLLDKYSFAKEVYKANSSLKKAFNHEDHG